MKRFFTIPYIRTILYDNPYHLKNHYERDVYLLDVPYVVSLVRGFDKQEYSLSRDYFKFNKCMEGYINPYEFRPHITELVKNCTQNNQTLKIASTFEVVHKRTTMIGEHRAKALHLTKVRNMYSNRGENEIKTLIKYNKQFDNVSGIWYPVLGGNLEELIQLQ